MAKFLTKVVWKQKQDTSNYNNVILKHFTSNQTAVTSTVTFKSHTQKDLFLKAFDRVKTNPVRLHQRYLIA